MFQREMEEELKIIGGRENEERGKSEKRSNYNQQKKKYYVKRKSGDVYVCMDNFQVNVVYPLHLN